MMHRVNGSGIRSDSLCLGVNLTQEPANANVVILFPLNSSFDVWCEARKTMRNPGVTNRS